ncbi:MAG TPA: PspC domain-containing protein [Gammaproteobacteria bacterium]|nr:PspC domain-containing protein [Gammaproteobacteria bacterium]HET7586822.1 PspC domain-containing protein [Gammaproteobacteria bacterium]
MKMYRDSERGVILGVCAGIAEYFGWPLWLTRVVTFGLGWFFTVPVVIAYIVAALLMPERPLRYYGDVEERAFWHVHSRRS